MCGPAGCGYCGPMQSVGSMYYKLYTMLCRFASLQICRSHSELCIVGLVLCMVRACRLQPLRANAKCRPYEFQYQRDLHHIAFYLQTLSNALLRGLGGGGGA